MDHWNAYYCNLDGVIRLRWCYPAHNDMVISHMVGLLCLESLAICNHALHRLKKPKTMRYPSLKGTDPKFRRNHRHALHGTMKALGQSISLKVYSRFLSLLVGGMGPLERILL
jgi:hypothetical protein